MPFQEPQPFLEKYFARLYMAKLASRKEEWLAWSIPRYHCYAQISGSWNVCRKEKGKKKKERKKERKGKEKVKKKENKRTRFHDFGLEHIVLKMVVMPDLFIWPGCLKVPWRGVFIRMRLCLCLCLCVCVCVCVCVCAWKPVWGGRGVVRGVASIFCQLCTGGH